MIFKEITPIVGYCLIGVAAALLLTAFLLWISGDSDDGNAPSRNTTNGDGSSIMHITNSGGDVIVGAAPIKTEPRRKASLLDPVAADALLRALSGSKDDGKNQ